MDKYLGVLEPDGLLPANCWIVEELTHFTRSTILLNLLPATCSEVWGSNTGPVTAVASNQLEIQISKRLTL